MKVLKDRKPELEHELIRSADLGFEANGSHGYIRCLMHGLPSPQVRWHYHEEYELHLIVETHGKAFVGDYIGNFEPGHLVLVGPRLPHNWISSDIPEPGIPLRGLGVQFTAEPIRAMMDLVPELRELMPLLDRARYGIEFFGISPQARKSLECIQTLRGVRRLIEFIRLLNLLMNCSDYKLLSKMPIQPGDDTFSSKIDAVIEHIMKNHAANLSRSELSQMAGMSKGQFSRHFQKITGNNFTDFVNRSRVARACQLLVETNDYITNICYEVGFNNVANFNRRFLQIKGVTPKEFRRQFGECFS